MPEAKQKFVGNPGLIQVECPVEGCEDVHRIPVNIEFTYGYDEDGDLSIGVYPKPDISRMSDHMVFEHGLI